MQDDGSVLNDLAFFVFILACAGLFAWIRDKYNRGVAKREKRSATGVSNTLLGQGGEEKPDAKDFSYHANKLLDRAKEAGGHLYDGAKKAGEALTKEKNESEEI